MPYTTLRNLPDNVKNVLPKHGQEIFLEAFNSAYDQYKDAADRNDDSGRDETARRVAWSAVKQSYEKSGDGSWLKKSS